MAEGAVTVEGLVKVFRSRRRDDVTAVDGVSFATGRGGILGLLGANGAGKTTTIKCLCGIIRPTSGRIVVNGHDVVADPGTAGAHIAAVLEGNRNLYWRMTVRENIEFFAGLQGIGLREVRSCRDDLIERFHLGEKARTPARLLSRGMQQKLALASALARQTPVLVLDEPTLGLDVETSQELRGHLRELASERTILLSSHDMDVVQEICDRVVVLARGSVVADDAVENLLALLRAQAYRFVLDRLSPSAQDAVGQRFGGTTTTGDDAGVSVDVELSHSSDLYELIELFRSDGAQVLNIQRNEPDLEKVFLYLLREHGR